MKKWLNPEMNNLTVKETREGGCPGFSPKAGVTLDLDFDSDSVIQNCKWCVEYELVGQACKYLGQDDAFCS